VRFVELPAASAPPPLALERVRAADPPPLAPMSNHAPRPAEPPRVPAPQVPLDPAVALAQAQADAQAAPPLGGYGRDRGAYEPGVDPKPRPQPEPRPRRILTAAGRSSVEPGSAVRVIASTTDGEGRALMTDLTSFGSQHYYRTGTFIASGSRERLFTRVVQKGERLWVTASLDRRLGADDAVTVEMRSGETREVALPNGRAVTLSPVMRPETAEERAGDHAAIGRADGDIDRSSRQSWRAYRDRCRAGSC
jgi:hypothetical protein